MSTTRSDVGTRLVGHLRANTTDMASEDLVVPARHFVSHERAEVERRLIRRVPVVVAHSSEISEPGSFVTRDVVGMPLIISRGGDGVARAHYNICRHRGGRVENEPSGAKRLFTCRYHGWTYSSEDGSLRNAPYDEFFDSLDYSCRGLNPVPVAERHSLIWATLDADDPHGLDDYLGPKTDAAFAEFGLDGTIMLFDQTVELEINWKLVMDGAVDVLHPKFLHPQGVGKLLETNTSVWESYGRHGQLFTPRKRLAELASSEADPEASWRYIATNLVVFPNTMVIAAPDHVELWTVWPSPTNPAASTTVIRFLIRPEILDAEMEQRVHRSWEILRQAAVDEDWPMERTIQANAAARPDHGYLYGRNEQPCQHLHRQLAAHLEGASDDSAGA
jgi:phenylpropionate dioxygenase-like ring-hydroxylating dioxygenase large terminal subunit